MRHGFIIILVLLSPSLLSLSSTATAQSGIQATNNQAVQKFPEWVAFSVDLKSESDITHVVLEYGVERLTCGTVIAKAFPEVKPSASLTAKWTWEMRQTGSQPPGATIWWRWRVRDASDHEFVTERKTITWLDNWRPWQKLSGSQIVLHWYSGLPTFAAELRDSAVKSLGNLAEQTGLKADSAIDIYVYADSNDLREAILYEPGWIGGAAFAEHNSVIIGISPNRTEWGKHAIAHELTHVLVGRYTFSCLGDEPMWLTEGLAMVGEGGLDADAQKRLKAVVTDDKLMSVRVLSGGFAEASDRADLSYSQSYSLVSFLIGEYGQDRMMALLRALREGTAFDQAMRAIYGFDIDGFEDTWRNKIGAKPRTSISQVAPTATPTIVPTIVPVAGVVTPTVPPTQAPVTATPTVTAMPAGTDTPVPVAMPAPAVSAAPLPIVAIVAGVVVVIALLFASFVLVRRQKR